MWTPVWTVLDTSRRPPAGKDGVESGLHEFGETMPRAIVLIERPYAHIPAAEPAPRWWRWLRRALLLLLLLAVAAAAVAAVRVYRFVNDPVPVPRVEPRDPLASLFDTTPVPITLTAAWQKARRTVPAYQLLRDHTIWQGMHFGDWDGVPPPIRERALTAMIERYERVFTGPRVWRRMSIHEWDAVPQAIRTMAYLRMVWYWADYEQVGVEFGLEPSRVAQTIGAIVMSESWFEHRAINENQWGNRDLGLAQCSDHCRRVLGEMAEAGEIGFVLSEEDYFDPWVGTRVATVWFKRELGRADGNIDLAIRAYHRGMDAASEGEGQEYAEGVRRRRAKYILRQGAPESWQFLAREIAGIGS